MTTIQETKTPLLDGSHLLNNPLLSSLYWSQWQPWTQMMQYHPQLARLNGLLSQLNPLLNGPLSQLHPLCR